MMRYGVPKEPERIDIRVDISELEAVQLVLESSAGLDCTTVKRHMPDGSVMPVTVQTSEGIASLVYWKGGRWREERIVRHARTGDGFEIIMVTENAEVKMWS